MLQTESPQRQQQQNFANDLQEVLVAGAGVLTLTIIGATSVRVLIAEVSEGDPFAKAVLQASQELLHRIDRRSRKQALLCLLCDEHAVSRGESPGALAILTPFGVLPVRVAVGTAICANCAADRAETALASALVAKLRAIWMPDLRTFQPMPAGHA